MTAYYNENNPQAAAWLRELIKAGHIADGDVDERSITEVDAVDVSGYTQCHFFAGIGGWSYALRLAGWPDDKPVWTGSCPCQPFSTAGKRRGFADERHLWPNFFRLISQCRPATVFGEQVASKDGLAWLDTVCADLERADYACGAVDTCASGFGAPHIRQRLYWVANTVNNGTGRKCGHGAGEKGTPQGGRAENSGLAEAGNSGTAHGVAHADSDGCGSRQWNDTPARYGNTTSAKSNACRMADADNTRPQGRNGNAECANQCAPGQNCMVVRPGPTNGHWRDADWLYCRDGKWRPVEPSTFPLAHGLPARVVRLRGYGNAIVPQVAAAFVSAFMEVNP